MTITEKEIIEYAINNFCTFFGEEKIKTSDKNVNELKNIFNTLKENNEKYKNSLISNNVKNIIGKQYEYYYIDNEDEHYYIDAYEALDNYEIDECDTGKNLVEIYIDEINKEKIIIVLFNYPELKTNEKIMKLVSDGIKSVKSCM